MNNGKKSKISTRTLVQASILVAISIVLTRFLVIMVPQTLRLGFGELPLMLSGFLFGPVIGGLSGLVADLVGATAFPQGPYYPGFTLSSMLWGIIPGLFAIYFRSKKETKDVFSLLRVSITVSVAMLVISLGLNTFWLSQLFDKGFLIMVPGRIANVIFSTPIQSYVITVLMKHLRPLTELNK